MSEKIDRVKHAFSLIIGEAGSLGGLHRMMIILHTLKQKKALLVLEKINSLYPGLFTLLTGMIKGVSITNHVLLREHLHRNKIPYSHKESINLFLFLKRVLKKIEEKGLKF